MVLPKQDFGNISHAPGNFEDAKRLLKELAERQTLPTQIVYFWPLGTVETASDQVDVSTRFVPFLSLLVLVRAIPETMSAPLQLSVITSASQDVLGTEVVNVSQAELRGLCQVVTQEYPLVGCRQIDLDSECSWPPQMTHKMERELRSSDPSTQVAYRGLHRWTHDYEPVQLPKLGGWGIRNRPARRRHLFSAWRFGFCGWTSFCSRDYSAVSGAIGWD